MSNLPNGVWSTEEAVEFEDIMSVDFQPQYDTFLRVNNSDIELVPGDDLKGAVITAAQDAEMGKFNLFVNGVPLSEDEISPVIEEGVRYEIRPYDEPGSF